jgi:Cu2+-exporting ATPase
VRALFDANAIRRRTQVMILVFSVVYNLLAVGLAVAGLMSPMLAAIMMPINSLLTLGIVTSGMKAVFRPASAGGNPR